MFKIFVPWLLVILSYNGEVWGFGQGAPATKCGTSGNMVPDHGYPAETASLPYSLTSTSALNTYSPGETVSCK